MALFFPTTRTRQADSSRNAGFPPLRRIRWWRVVSMRGCRIFDFLVLRRGMGRPRGGRMDTDAAGGAFRCLFTFFSDESHGVLGRVVFVFVFGVQSRCFLGPLASCVSCSVLRCLRFYSSKYRELLLSPAQWGGPIVGSKHQIRAGCVAVVELYMYGPRLLLYTPCHSDTNDVTEHQQNEKATAIHTSSFVNINTTTHATIASAQLH